MQGSGHGLFSSVAVIALLLIAALVPARATAAQHFDTPEAASDAFVIAVAARRQDDLKRILGDDWRSLIPVEKIDRSDVDRFLDSWAVRHTVERRSAERAELVVGREAWPLPIPIVWEPEGWRFDAAAGREEILTRRIGRNELAAIMACLAYFDAQKEYALKDHNGDGVLEYAQRLISTPGLEDGLYWAALPGEEESPLGPLFGTAAPDDVYHGYHFRILTGQGPSASGGAYDYRINGRMVAGFGLVAWPARHGETGVMTFQLNHDGLAYQEDLGSKTDEIARAMIRFDPEPSWTPVKVP